MAQMHFQSINMELFPETKVIKVDVIPLKKASTGKYWQFFKNEYKDLQFSATSPILT